MFPLRALASLSASVFLLAASLAQGAIGIEPIADQSIPSGKTLVVPIAATDPTGPGRSYTVTVGKATTNGSTPATAAGIMATLRTGDPHLLVAVSYASTASSTTTEVVATGTMDFQLLREFCPVTTEAIGGLTAGGHYSPEVVGSSTSYETFGRVVVNPSPFVVQLGGLDGDGRGGAGFTFENEFSTPLIFSGTLGQLSMANGGTNTDSQQDGFPDGPTNGSQYFITLVSTRSLDFQHTIFGQLIRGADTLNGVANTPISPVVSGTVGGEPEYSTPYYPVNITSTSVVPNNTDAVLLLSATGICQSVITVTSYSSGTSAVQKFIAHADQDTVNDPPFLKPVPDTTGSNGNLNIALSGTDLQLDLLSYGYQQLLPHNSGVVTVGTSSTVTIPLAYNAANTVEAVVDHWIPSSRGFDGRVFQVGAGALPLTGTLSAIPAHGFGTDELPAGFRLATFTSRNPGDKAASFSTTVNWGDGTVLSSTQVSISYIGGSSTFALDATHKYNHVGEFPVLVNISDPAGAYLTLTGTANVASSALVVSGSDIAHAGGSLSNEVVATFTDGGTSGGTYGATINWGDGSASSGTIKAAGSSFEVLGSHTYHMPGAFTVSTVVNRASTGGYSAHTWVTAQITGVAAPQIFPPFPQAHVAQLWTALTTSSNSLANTLSSVSGGNPIAPLVRGTDGYLYGTTPSGGTYGYGTVFKMSESGAAFATLYNFTNGADGATPYAPLYQATDGAFYGTTTAGGTSGYGTVYRITSAGSFNKLYTFTDGTDGAAPYAGLVQAGTGGPLYGTAETGGTAGDGTVFAITTSGSLTTLHSFNGSSDGAHPYSALVEGTGGLLYGTTLTGSGADSGTIYKISETGSFTQLYAFISGTATEPYGGLAFGPNGNLYGTTEIGGTNGEAGATGAGTIYEITTSGSLTLLHSFTGNGDGGTPFCTLALDRDGNFYGTASKGGTVDTGGTNGTLYRITPSGTFTTLYSFTGPKDGEFPYAGLIALPGGDLRGVTQMGGANGYGTVFTLTTGASGAVTPISQFASGSSGFQICLTGAVELINSGNKTSPPGSFSVYADTTYYFEETGTFDGQQVLLSSPSLPLNNNTAISIPSLKPGQSTIVTFYQQGSAVDNRLKLPPNYDPTGVDSIIGVVTYSDPIGDFDGSAKLVSPFQF